MLLEETKILVGQLVGEARTSTQDSKNDRHLDSEISRWENVLCPESLGRLCRCDAAHDMGSSNLKLHHIRGGRGHINIGTYSYRTRIC